MESLTEKFLNETTDDVKKDLAWLVNHDFDLDEEQYYGYGAEREIVIKDHKIIVSAYYHFQGSKEWSISLKFQGESTVTYFKFKNGDISLKAKRVQEAIETAFAELTEVPNLNREIKRLRDENEREFKEAQERLAQKTN